MLLASLICAALAVGVMKTGTPVYSTEMMIAPPLQLAGSKLDIRATMDDLSSVADSLGDLSSLTGGASGSGTREFRRFLTLVQSRAVAERLYKNPEVLHEIFYKQWNAEENEWRKPGKSASVGRAVDQFFNIPVFDTPTVEHVQKWLERSISVREDKTTGSADLVIRSRRPEFGEQMLSLVHSEADSLLREAALRRAREQVAYLEDRVKGITQADQRKAVVRLLLSQEAQVMLAQTKAFYAADIIVAPTTKERPVSPSPKLFIMLAMVAGAFGTAILLYLRELLRRDDALPDSADGDE